MPSSWPVAPRSLQGTNAGEPIAEAAVRRPSECSPTSPIRGRLSLGRPGPWRIGSIRRWLWGSSLSGNDPSRPVRRT
jgi:hypothetical protein